MNLEHDFKQYGVQIKKYIQSWMRFKYHPTSPVKNFIENTASKYGVYGFYVRSYEHFKFQNLIYQLKIKIIFHGICCFWILKAD